jgi:chromosome partitioning protein
VEGNQAFEILHQSNLLSASDLEALSTAYDYVIVDAPPSISGLTQSVLEASDVAVIPVTPSSLDLWACTDTLKIVKEIQNKHPDLKVKFLINRKITGTRSGREIKQALKEFDTGIINTELCQRVAYVDAMKHGVSVMQYAPGSKAAQEIEQLCDEITNENGQATGAAEMEETQLKSIYTVYQEETDNILFRSFQNL